MAKCAYCGAVTLLYSFEIPICLDCVDARSKNGIDRKPQQSEKAPKDQPESQYRKAAGR
jgi:hypothetical protein